ncbi:MULTISPECIES: histidine phosphatase family protein [Microbacterium]|uniref:histidine phosphatase family protein n=1 Tax=Microbacterium TaxID=33882 RepID=UPI00068DEA68|nr:histidine phosphatase family protein [Microbacterium profundi]MCE7483169.1 histidine phosphatase family protein [Microbacterium profundi]
MTTLYFARHGETEWHAEHRYAGSSDVALVPDAIAQAAGLATWASTTGLSAIIASPLSRARLTAEPAAEASGLPLRIDPRLVEIDFGRGEGMSPAELEAAFPEDWAGFERQPAQHPLPGGESGRAGIARAMPVLDELAAEFPDGRVLVVGHATLMRLLLCELVGLDPDWYRDIFPALDNSALLELDFPYEGESDWPGRARILGINVPPISHVPRAQLQAVDPEASRE